MATRRGSAVLIAAVQLTAVMITALFTALPAAAQTEDESPSAEANAIVTAAYEGLLGRAPDPAGLEYWTAQIDSGTPAGTVVERIGDAEEQRALVVREAYEQILDRAPEPEGLAYWSVGIIDRLTARSLAALMFGSPEFYGRAGGSDVAFVTALYRRILDREPEAAGLDFWVNALAEGNDRSSVADLFLDSPEGLLQPDLSIVSSVPARGSTTRSLAAVEIELDRDVIAEASSIIVAVGGVRVPGRVVAADGGANRLRFEATPTVLPLTLGAEYTGVVTAFAYDGTVVERADFGFRYVHNATALSPENELMVAFYGHPRAPVLGVAGEGTPAEALVRLQAQAAPYAASGKVVVPTFELIATLVTASPGPDGLYRSRVSDAEVRPYLDTIRTVGGRIILDIQPGRADVLDEARAYESLLLEPEIGLALDPEWVVGPTQTPAGRIGTLDASNINRVSAYLSDLVVANDLPPKILIVHRFTAEMVTNTDAIVSRPGIRILFHADGEGGPGAKIADYDGLLPPRFERGIKIFYDEDVNRMSPTEVLDRLDPDPSFVSYQ